MTHAPTSRPLLRRAAVLAVLVGLGAGLSACDRCGNFNPRLPGTGSCSAPAPVR